MASAGNICSAIWRSSCKVHVAGTSIWLSELQVFPASITTATTSRAVGQAVAAASAIHSMQTFFLEHLIAGKGLQTVPDGADFVVIQSSTGVPVAEYRSNSGFPNFSRETCAVHAEALSLLWIGECI